MLDLVDILCINYNQADSGQIARLDFRPDHGIVG